jgi:predicted O-methyltransferase YrrM
MFLRNKPRDLVRHTFQYSEGYIRPDQIEEEIANLVEDVHELSPVTILEIGTWMGGTLYLWACLARPDAVIISVDLPGGKFGGGYSSRKAPLYRRFAWDRQKIHLIRADSHDASTLTEVQRVLGGRSVDFLFIDGDHTYEGVRQDWSMYSPLVRPGGLVAFHDIAGNYGNTRVKTHWEAIKYGYAYREYVVNPEGRYGIGVLVKRQHPG